MIQNNDRSHLSVTLVEELYKEASMMNWDECCEEQQQEKPKSKLAFFDIGKLPGAEIKEDLLRLKNQKVLDAVSKLMEFKK